MSGFSRREEIEQALTLLGRHMALNGAPDLTLVCCGGAALCMLRPVERTTKDLLVAMHASAEEIIHSFD